MTPSPREALSPAPSSTKSVKSWKPMGSIHLLFCSSGENEESNYRTLECSLSLAACHDDDDKNAVIGRPSTLVSDRILSSPRQYNDCFLLQSSTNDSSRDENLHMGTINAMLLSLKSAMLFRDQNDSSRLFVYTPRSLHTASLVECNQQASRLKVSSQVKPTAESPVSVVNDTQGTKADTEASTKEDEAQDSLAKEIVEAVDPSELEKLYQQCIESGTPNPYVFCQQAAVSLSEQDVPMVKELLATSSQLQDAKTDIVRTLQVQVGLRLALSSVFPNFNIVHHELVFKSAAEKKVRKRLKRTDPKQLFQDQVLSLLSLLQIRCDPPSDFALMVKQLCVNVSEEMVDTIYNHLELYQDEHGDEEMELPSVPPAAPRRSERDMPSTRKETLPLVGLKKEPETSEPSDDALFVPKSIPLTSSQSIRKNSLVPDRKRKYVGSHFGTRLSNASNLFRQVKAPVPSVPPRAKATKSQASLLKHPSPKRPRTVCFRRGATKQVITETPAKRLAYELSPVPHALSPMGRSDSQNARVVAQEALAAARRKIVRR